MSYSVELKHGEDLFKSKGDTLVEALEKLEFDRFQIKAKGLLKAKHKKSEAEMPVTALQARKIKTSKMVREILAGKLSNQL